MILRGGSRGPGLAPVRGYGGGTPPFRGCRGRMPLLYSGMSFLIMFSLVVMLSYVCMLYAKQLNETTFVCLMIFQFLLMAFYLKLANKML